MTAQIDDIFIFNDTEFAVAGISAGELFEPTLLGLEPFGTCSACWRGYQAVFALSGSRLILDTLHVELYTVSDNFERQDGPLIKGVSPTGPKDKDDWFNNQYTGLEGFYLGIG